MKQYLAVLLDADDTIFDFAACERKALIEALDASGVYCTPEMAADYAAINRCCWKAMERGEMTVSRLRVARFERFCRRYGMTLDPARLTEVYGTRLAGAHILLPGAREFLRQASALAPLYLTTNGIAAVQRQRVADAGIGTHLSGIFISEEIGHSKPSSAYYDAVFAALPGLSAADCIAFGDSLTSDIAGAAGAGVDSCWYNPQGLLLQGDVQPTYTVSCYADFLSLLGGGQ